MGSPISTVIIGSFFGRNHFTLTKAYILKAINLLIFNLFNTGAKAQYPMILQESKKHGMPCYPK